MNPDFLTLADRRLAYQSLPRGREKYSVLFLGGFASDMTGTKASYLAERCGEQGIGFTRFDYRGHGTSSGDFKEGCIGDWLDDACKIMEQVTEGKQIVVGSSMGGWIGLLMAKQYPERFHAFIGIAAAPDFTEELMWKTMTTAQRTQLQRDGYMYEADAPEDFRHPITLNLIEEGRNHLILNAPIGINCPVRLLQGLDDMDVPWAHALRIAEQVESTDVRVTLVKNGDHRLSKPDDLSLLWQSIQEFVS